MAVLLYFIEQKNQVDENSPSRNVRFFPSFHTHTCIEISISIGGHTCVTGKGGRKPRLFSSLSLKFRGKKLKNHGIEKKPPLHKRNSEKNIWEKNSGIMNEWPFFEIPFSLRTASTV